MIKRTTAILLVILILTMQVFAGTSTVITGYGTSTVTFTNNTFNLSTLSTDAQNRLNTFENVLIMQRGTSEIRILYSDNPITVYKLSSNNTNLYAVSSSPIYHDAYTTANGWFAYPFATTAAGVAGSTTGASITYTTTGTNETTGFYIKGTLVGSGFTLNYDPIAPELPPVIAVTDILEPVADPYQTTNSYVDMTTLFSIETTDTWDSTLLEINYTNDGNIVPDSGMQQLYNQITTSDETTMDLTEGYVWRMETRQTMRILDIAAGSHTLGIQIVYNGEVIASSTKSVEILSNFVDADGDGIDDRTGESQDAGTWNPIVVAVKSALAPITNIFKGIGNFFSGITNWFTNLWTIIVNGITSVTSAINSMIAVFIDIMSFLPGNSGTILFSGFVVVILIIIINIVRGR